MIERSESHESESKAATELREQVLDLEHKYNDASTKLREIQEEQLEKERTFVSFIVRFVSSLVKTHCSFLTQ